MYRSDAGISERHEGATMFQGNEFSFGYASEAPAVQLRRIPVDGTWPAAPTLPEIDPAAAIAESVARAWRAARLRLQRAIDGVETQIALLDETGAITAVNRAWRMTAKINGLDDPQFGLGQNYLAICRTAAAGGDRDAASTAEGLERVMQGDCRSFYYKYAWVRPNERRLYALLAWRMVEQGTSYVAVSHELLETHAR